MNSINRREKHSQIKKEKIKIQNQINSGKQIK